MKSNSHILVCLIIYSTFSSTLANLENAFEEHDLVPDILRVAPKKMLNVRDIKNS